MSDEGENGSTPRKRKSSDGSAEDWVTWNPDSDRFFEEIVGEGVKLVMKYLKPAMEDNRSRIIKIKNSKLDLDEERWVAVTKQVSRSMYGKGNKVGATPVIRQVMGPYMETFNVSKVKIEELFDIATQRQKGATRQSDHREQQCQRMQEELNDLAEVGRQYGIDVQTVFQKANARTAMATAITGAKSAIEKCQQMQEELAQLTEIGGHYGVVVSTVFQPATAQTDLATAISDARSGIEEVNRRQCPILLVQYTDLGMVLGNYPEGGTMEEKHEYFLVLKSGILRGTALLDVHLRQLMSDLGVEVNGVVEPRPANYPRDIFPSFKDVQEIRKEILESCSLLWHEMKRYADTRGWDIGAFSDGGVEGWRTAYSCYVQARGLGGAVVGGVTNFGIAFERFMKQEKASRLEQEERELEPELGVAHAAVAEVDDEMKMPAETCDEILARGE